MRKPTGKRSSFFRPSFLALEARDVPAGNIQAFVNGGVLTIRTDNDDFHAIDISGCGQRSVMIRPAVGTTINGQSGPLWFGDITKGFDIQTGNGADSIVMSGVNGRDYISIVTNGGDDVVHLVGGTRSDDSTWIRTGDGNDIVVISDVEHRDHFAMLTGAGDDRVVLTNATFGRNPTMDGEAGNDGFTQTNTTARNQKNFETAAGSLETPPDSTAPTVTLSSSSATSVNAAFTVTATFSESVTGFAADDLTVTNGTVSNFAASNGSVYTFTVTPTAAGAVTIVAKAAAAVDAAGNVSAVSDTLTRTFDNTGPTLSATALTTNDTTPTITGSAGDASTVSITVNDQTVNATVSGGNWTATLPTALAQGTYNIVVNGKDLAGNTGTSTLSNGLVIDTTVPTVTVTTQAPASTDQSPIRFQIAFSENVTGLTLEDFDVTNGTAGNLLSTDAKNYTVDVTPNVDGNVTIFVKAEAALDVAQNKSTVSDSVTRDFTGAAPGVTFTGAAATNTTPITITAQFTENVSDLSLDDFTVTNAEISELVTVSGSKYTFLLTPSAEGAVTVLLKADAVTDDDGRKNAQSSTFTSIYDLTDPTGTINAKVSTSNTPTITGTVSETGSKVSVTVNAQTVNATVTDKTWTAVLTSEIADGTYDVSITVTDAAGNSSDNSLADGLTVDATVPTATITSTTTSPTTATSMTVTVAFSEDVNDFTQSDLTLTNGTISGFSVTNDKTYTFTVTPTADGAATVALAAGKATDDAGNGNAAATTLSVVFDHTNPTATFNTNSVNAVTGRSSDAHAGVSTTTVSISDGTNFYDGSGFTSATEVFLPTTTETNGNWRFTLSTPGNYTTKAKVTDLVGNVATVNGSVTISAPTLTNDTGMVNTKPSYTDPNFILTQTGLGVWDTLVGDGAAVTSSSNLNVYYTGWLPDGTVFDSRRSPSAAASFPLSNLIQGWKEGLIGMKVGGIRRLAIPSELAYGEAGFGSSIPPNTDLIFEIKLVGVS